MNEMNEIINIRGAEEKMRNINIIIYGTVRDIEIYFMESFTNLDILADFFNNVTIIIFENDSKDNTRKMLQSWKSTETSKVNKHLILESGVDVIYPLRATRLAYCRNKILQYIFENNLDSYHEYAFHCDLDNRFWCVDYKSICNSFQYDLNSWDVMTSIGKNKTYYDYWALRINDSWFNKNIFSCEAENIDFTTKKDEFIQLLKGTNALLKTNSSFNGLGIYKLSKLKTCRYDASYKCNKCFNKNRGCFEDNDHIGLHNAIVANGGNIFINTKMKIISKPSSAISYKNFINQYLSNATNINDNLLLYVLKNNMVNNTYSWIDIGTNIEEVVTSSIISEYNTKDIYSFNLNNENDIKSTYLKGNVKRINTNITDFSLKYNEELDNKYLSLICFDTNDYITVKSCMNTFFNKIQNNCVIIFDKCINYKGYTNKSLKAFYEITQEYNISFDVIGINDVFIFDCPYSVLYNHNDTHNTSKMLVIKILNNPVLKNTSPQKSNIDYNIFDWKMYALLNTDLTKKLISAEMCWNHLIRNGINENRKICFHWKKYIEDFPTIDKNKNAALNHAIKNNNVDKYSIICNFNKEKNDRLIEKYNKIYNNIIPHDFNWVIYLILNTDLIYNNILTEEQTFMHWIKNGHKKNRRYNI